MARARSPEYPAISLKEAIDRVKMIYDKDYQNRLPRKVIAEHMGYKGLSGASLPILSALMKYGLLEGRGDETRVSDLAVKILAHAPGSPERMEALWQASSFPELFADLDKRFPDGKASDQAIRSYLLTSKFIPGAADAVVRAYRDTKQFVTGEAVQYIEDSDQEPSMLTATSRDVNMGQQGHSLLDRPSSSIKPPTAKSPMLQEVFNLDEGPVTLAFPSTLSPESYEDLKDQLELFLRRAQRRAQLSNLGPMPDRLRNREGRRTVADDLANSPKDEEAAN
jgi:hypothetical protein